jgi:V/A-type H+-transporting ATPase subunit A
MSSYIDKKKAKLGKIVSIDGPVIGIQGLENHKIGDLVKIGEKRLLGEIVKIVGSKSISQCYEDTEGLKIYESVENTGYPLSMQLGPGLLNMIYDGIQRPLNLLLEQSGDYIESGIDVFPLDINKKWDFIPTKIEGEQISGGDIIGSVRETASIDHKIMIPLGISGTIKWLAEESKFNIKDTICEIKTSDGIKEIGMLQQWSIRQPRPYVQRMLPTIPLITGMRVIDLLYPVPKGGAVSVPGGFGTGKTVIQHNLAKWADANIIVYIGCGERGNEMAEVLEDFPKLTDPRQNLPLMARTVLIGNTSNMPVSAREASIFSGLTIAEYFRDMGYHVAVLADSTSRWAEALRELSGRMEEMPAEGGYPSYLASRLSNFYERAGFVVPYGSPNRMGSITLVGAVSPPSGDFSEPVTKTTKRFTRAFWALDAKLAYSRHYPAISWTDSYSLYGNYLDKWWNSIEKGWNQARIKVTEMLAESDKYQNIVQLVGKENLPNEQQLVLFIAELIKQVFLIQSAFDDIDRYCSPVKTLKLIKIILLFYDKSLEMIKINVPLYKIEEMTILTDISRARLSIRNEDVNVLEELRAELLKEFASLYQEYRSSQPGLGV